jgi:hypothetical protein
VARQELGAAAGRGKKESLTLRWDRAGSSRTAAGEDPQFVTGPSAEVLGRRAGEQPRKKMF